MKYLIYVIFDVFFAIMFWFGLPVCVLYLRELSSLERASGILTGREEFVSHMEECRGSIELRNMLDVNYRIYIIFPNSQLNREDKAYFDGRTDERNSFFWEAIGTTLDVTILDECGRVVLPAVEGDAYNQFIFGPPGTGQSIGVLDNSRLDLDRITIQYSIDANCQKLLSYEPRILVLAAAQKEIVIARLGMISLAISCLWIAGKWLRRALAKFGQIRRGHP